MSDKDIPQDVPGFVADEYLQLLQTKPEELAAVISALGPLPTPESDPAAYLPLVSTILQAAVQHARNLLQGMPRSGTHFTSYGQVAVFGRSIAKPAGCNLLLVKPTEARVTQATGGGIAAQVVPMTGDGAGKGPVAGAAPASPYGLPPQTSVRF